MSMQPQGVSVFMLMICGMGGYLRQNNRFTACNLRALLSENPLGDPAACGRLRTRAVGITGSVFEPLNESGSIEAGFGTLLTCAPAITKPFEDVNKRGVAVGGEHPIDSR